MLSINGVSKTYAKKSIKAVDDVSLKIEAGDLFGIVGPNGAGKSTLIKMIVGILKIDEGDIEICGKSINKQSELAKSEIGYVSDNHALLDRLTGREYLNFIANIFGMEKEDAESQINKYVDMFKLTHAINDSIKQYSHGMKQKLSVISCLIHNPKVWVLDEPLMGLDVESAFILKECMKEHCRKGNIVLFSSHVLDVVEKLCNKVAIINNGKIELIGEVDSLMGDVGSLEQTFLNLIKAGKNEKI